jgi:site-specific recombinase XerC
MPTWGPLLSTCAGTDFTARRDTAIIMLFLDGGLRLSELAGLQVTDVDLRDRIVFVVGKASRRSGPRHRAVPLGSRRPGRWIATCASGAGTRMRTRRGSGWAAEAGRPLMLMGSRRC